jgi:leucyl aminopeptidase (aminopeptidase T)
VAEISRGAAIAVHKCMGVQRDDKVVVLTDRAREHIGHALAAECEIAGAQTRLLVLDDFTERPAKGYPDNLRAVYDEIRPTCSFLALAGQEGELALRVPLIRHIVYEIKARHGHMINIDDQVMTEGMTADYDEIARITGKVNEIVKDARIVDVQAPSGTDMRATLDPSRRRWHPCPGIYHRPGEWGNLPEGETFTSPMSLEGVLGAEVLGDYFSERYGVLAHPVRLEVEGGRVRKVITPDDEVKRDLDKYFSQHENSNRAGEFAIGTNVALKKLSGNLLQDEKIPGVHVAFGDPYAEETGADWSCPSHCDLVSTRSTIKVDGQYLMRQGEFVA